MLVNEEIMEKINDVGCKFSRLKNVSKILSYCVLGDFYIDSRVEILSFFGLFYDAFLEAQKDYEKLTAEIEFGKSDDYIKRNNEDDED